MIDHLSFSSISKYLKCHRQWKHKYIDGWEEKTGDALLFGSAWHKMIRISMEESSNDFLLWDEFSEKYELSMDLNITGNRMIADSHIKNTIKSLKPMPESIEKKIELHIPGVEVPIIGYIDMIEDETMIPVDFKTSKSKWSVPTEKNNFVGKADVQLQATFYIAALEQAGMIELPHTFRYIVFTKTSKPTVQILDTVRTAADIFELHEMVNDVWSAIKLEAFGKCDPGMWWCSQKWCSFYDRCKS